MGIFQGDMIIKTAIELGIEDMRKNPWLIDHMFEDLITSPYLKDKYGQKQIDACKEWFANNKIEFYMALRKDKDKTPCITISMGNSPEKQDMKTMADQSTETVLLMPNTIGKPIPYVVKPFVPLSYDQSTGELAIPGNAPGSDGIAPGMILVDPATGNGYGILEITEAGILIEADTKLNASKYGIVPQFQVYKARVEHSFFQESYTIGCHAHGDPQNLLWLWSIAMYSIMRYRESLLEASGFTESLLSSSDLQEDSNYGGVEGEEVFRRYITITGQVENSWVKSPRRFIESVALKEKTSKGFLGGIKILSNEDSPAFIDKANEIWYTDNENGDDSTDPEDENE
jgi:hypothetical protein